MGNGSSSAVAESTGSIFRFPSAKMGIVKHKFLIEEHGLKFPSLDKGMNIFSFKTSLLVEFTLLFDASLVSARQFSCL